MNRVGKGLFDFFQTCGGWKKTLKELIANIEISVRLDMLFLPSKAIFCSYYASSSDNWRRSSFFIWFTLYAFSTLKSVGYNHVYSYDACLIKQRKINNRTVRIPYTVSLLFFRFIQMSVFFLFCFSLCGWLSSVSHFAR